MTCERCRKEREILYDMLICEDCRNKIWEENECEYCSNTATVTHKNTIGEIVKLCKSCKETQTKV